MTLKLDFDFILFFCLQETCLRVETEGSEKIASNATLIFDSSRIEPNNGMVNRYKFILHLGLVFCPFVTGYFRFQSQRVHIK
jgi:hypothetical protein